MWWLICALLIIVILVMLYYYREDKNPPILEKKDIPSNVILSPAYGIIEHIKKDVFYNEVTISLNVFDNHTQYVPCPGIIQSVNHYPGTHPWFGRDSNAEQQHFVINSRSGEVKVIQRAGYVFKRLHSNVKVDDVVETNDKLGHIDFGSMVIIEIPSSLKLIANVGDKVYGGRTVLAIK